MITKKNIIDKTHYGLKIYGYILKQYYSGSINIYLKGRECRLTRNPFNENKETLYIQNKEGGPFLHECTEKSIKEGDCFDFAELYYNTSGEELLFKINEDLSLNIGKENPWSKRQKVFQKLTLKEADIR